MPQKPEEPGGMLFWAEDSSASQPDWLHGRLPLRPKIKIHPYIASPEQIAGVLRRLSGQDSVTLRLPSTRTGPVPSPKLAHNWVLDSETKPFLAPWIIKGIWLLPQDALPLLIDLPLLERRNRNIFLADDARYWRIVASVSLEALAAQKVVPVVIHRPMSSIARWQPVLDHPRDAQRLSFLEKSMPPVCLAEIPANTPRDNPPAPVAREILVSFLNATCDSLARQWGWSELRRANTQDDQLGQRWLSSLFQADPRIKGTPAQLQSLASGFNAWIRNLHISGDSSFHISFRLQPPAPKGTGEIEESQSSPLALRSRPDEDTGVKNAPDQWKLHYLIQARDDPSLLIPADAVWKTSNGSLVLMGRRFDNPQEKLLAGLGYAGRFFSPIASSLREKSPTSITLDTLQAYSFLREVAPVLEEAGFGLLTPPWWKQRGARLGVRLRLSPSRGATPDAIAQGKLSFDHLIEYHWELSLGETALSEEEFRAMAALKTPLVQIRGQWVQLDPEQIEAAIHFWEKQKLNGKISLLEAVQMGMQAGENAIDLPFDDVVAEDWLKDWMDRFTQPGQLQQIPQPDSLNGELRPYQRYGFSWLSFFRQWKLGACLADDMGLGKTIQTLALLLKEKENLGTFPTPVLLVCPTSVVTNWEKESRRFAPSLSTFIHMGPSRQRGDAFLQAIQKIDLVVTSYPLVRLDAEFLQKVKWHGVILDEAQNIKNPNAQQTQMVRRLSAGFRLALTGTPIENRLSELWSIMHFLNPGFLGTMDFFRTNYALPIERYNDQKATLKLRQMVGPFILRRVKTDPTVIQDLPEKVETKIYCNLSEEQATLYQAVVENEMKKVEESSGMDRRGNVLSMLMQLKQVCNHPIQYLHQVRQSNQPFEPEVISRSGKLERLIEMLEELLEEGDRALIFSQFAEMGELLNNILPQALGCPVLFLHGGVPAKARDGLIKRFQEDLNGPPIFILSLKAGGIGLNLTRANHVFHFDRWWNPAVENQATDRAFRIGQNRNVQVHKYITVGTLEEMIDEMIESKQGLAQNIIGSGEGWLTELSTADLRDLVQLRRR
jgi:SNF2 family DNA or RNA helicase